jgi:hypothetical protein
MRSTLALAMGTALLATAGLAAAAPPGQATDPGERLDLSIRARGLGISPMTPTIENLGLESAKAPTGAGSLRMPSTTEEIAPGVYFTVAPTCLSGEDLPLGRRNVPPPTRRR